MIQDDTQTDRSPAASPLVADILGDERVRCETVPLDDELALVVVPKPGQTLTISTHRRIYSALVPVTTRSFGADMTLYWAQRSREGYLERLAEFLLLIDSDGALVGWSGFHVLSYDDYTIVYIDSTGMIPEWQSRRVMRRLMQVRVIGSALENIPQNKPVYLAARSESPVFYRLMRGLLGGGELYPNPNAAMPADIIRCGVELAEWLGQRHILDPPRLTLVGAYDALDALYGELPATGDVDLDSMFRERLGPLDAFLLIGRAR